MAKTIYLGNPNLKRQNVEIDYTEEQIQEYVKCRDDPIYFVKNYIHIVNLDKGLIKFELCRYSSAVVEQLTCNQPVGGSTPLPGTIVFNDLGDFLPKEFTVE